MRIKTKWHKKDRAKSLDELANTLGFIAWRIAQERADKMYSAGFNYSSHSQQLAVIGEFAAFLIHLADRLSYQRLDDEQRQRLVGILAQQIIDTMVDNLTEYYGPGEYRSGFVAKLNERLEYYAGLSFDDGPGYQMLRYLGGCIDEILGGGANKWATEQVVEIEAPEAVKALKKGFHDLLAQLDATADAE